MSVRTEQRLFYSRPTSTVKPVTDGTQSVTKTGYEHHCLFFAWFVAREELTEVIETALPEGFAMEGAPSINPIDLIEHYNVEVKGISYDVTPGLERFEGKHSIGV